MSWIYENIDCLSTPCGDITVTDEKGKKCVFSVKDNPYKSDYYLFYGTEREKAINTDTNYVISVDTDDFKIGQIYKICLTGGKLSYGDSDENTVAVSGISNGYSIAIGAFDHNDDEKLSQAYIYSRKDDFDGFDSFEYDKSNFIKYDVEMLEDYSGFSFRLLDKSEKYINFPVAWIENNYTDFIDYYENDEYYKTYYLLAVENWTT